MPSNFQVYNASAGSGKTFTLVKEYLKVVLVSDDTYAFQNILAITFTNKAAAEMKERILHNLQLFSEGVKNDLSISLFEETGIKESLMQQRSSRVLEAILRNYSAFGVTTIDSFTHKIIKSFAFDLGLSLNFEVELDSETLLNQAVDVLVSKIGIDKDITNTLIDFSIEKSQEDKSWDISKDLNEFAKILLNDEDAVHFKSLSSKTIDDFIGLKNKLIKHQKELQTEFNRLGKNGIEILENAGLNRNDFLKRPSFPDHFANLATNISKLKFFDNSALKKAIVEQRFYTKSIKENVKQIIEGVLPSLLVLYQESEFIYKQHVLNQLVLKSIIPLAVLTRVNAELSTIKEENNIRLISEFNQIISDNIKEEPAPFIYEKIGQKFMHYFIDEMQDTSVLQWQNLIPLIDNALAQENSNLLLVGDGKQAIYRWRGGKASQFIALGSEGSSNRSTNPFQSRKEVQGLETNYRSYSEVIEFNNSFFQFVSKSFQNPMYQQLFLEGNTQKITQKKGGLVSITFLEKEAEREDDELKYAKKVLEVILGLDKGFSRRDVCVLVRKKKEGVVVANYLSENGVAIVSSETLLIQNSKKVNFIINLLQVILHPKDYVTWIKVLYFLFEHLNIREEKHVFITSFDVKEQNLFFDRIKELGIDFNLVRFHQLPFYEKIEEIVRVFKLTEVSDAYVQFFLDVVFEQQQKGVDVQQFIDYWEHKKDRLSIVAPEAENAVQIMTIHKSKGLEFPVVVFPYNIDVYQQISPKSWITNLPNEQFNGFEELMVSATKNIQHAGEAGKRIFEFQREELELDSFNLLYVAFTRAEEQLYVVTEKTVSVKGLVNNNYTSGVLINYLKSIGEWSDDKMNYEFGNSKKVSKNRIRHSKAVIQEQFVSNSREQHDIRTVANSSLLWETAQGEAIVYGNLIHELFSKIYTSNDVEKVMRQYVRLGLIPVKDVTQVKKLIKAVVEHPDLDEYYQEHIVVYNERELVSKEGLLLIPDRLVFKNEKEVVLIDYKTGSQSKLHHQQLIEYEDVLVSMGLQVVRKLLIYINDQIQIEEI